MKRAAVYLVLIFLSVLTLVPFAYLASASLKPAAIMFDSLFLPTGKGFLGIAWSQLTLQHFLDAIHQPTFTQNVINSFFYASVTSVLATLSCAMGGYALAMFRFRGRTILTNLVLAALVIPATLLLAPTYQLIYRFGLIDTMTGLIFPGLAPAFGIFLFRQSMINTFPRDLMEAARIDGCGELRMFFSIALPIARPMISAFLLITFLACWNDFIHPQIILQSLERFPLSVAIAQMKDYYSQDYGLLMAGTLISILPVMVLFLLLQREFISGLTSGAVKG